MSMVGAISRTRPLLGTKKDIPLAMTKWWKKKKNTNAEITMHLSMHEQHAITPWLKTFPKKVVQRAPNYVWPVGTIGFVYGVIALATAVDEAEDLEHRF